MVRTRFFVLGALAWFSLASCGDGGTVELSVDLRTDYLAGIEFDQVRVQVDTDEQTVTAEPGTYSAGRRVLDLAGLAANERRELELVLLDAGAEVAARTVLVDRRSDTAVTVVVSRDCRGVTCATGGAAAASCLGGRCVDPACIEGDEPECDTPLCVADTDCPGRASCSRATCQAGVCLYESEDVCGDGFYCDPDDGCRVREAVCSEPLLSETFQLGGIAPTGREHLDGVQGVAGPGGVWLLLRYFETDAAGGTVRAARYLQKVGCDATVAAPILVAESASELAVRQGALAWGAEGLVVVGSTEDGVVADRFDPDTGALRDSVPVATTEDAAPFTGGFDRFRASPTGAGFALAGIRHAAATPRARQVFWQELDPTGAPLGDTWSAAAADAELPLGSGLAAVGGEVFDPGPGGLVYRSGDALYLREGDEPAAIPAFASVMPQGGLATVRVQGDTWIAQGTTLEGSDDGPIALARARDTAVTEVSNPDPVDHDYFPILERGEGAAAALAFSRATGTPGAPDYAEPLFVRLVERSDEGALVRGVAKEIPFEGTFGAGSSATMVEVLHVGQNVFLVIWHQGTATDRLFARFVQL